MQKTAEEFLREKLESEVGTFGDGTTEFHTRDLEFLLKCLDEKDEKIKALTDRLNLNAEDNLKELLTDCMTINNLSADQRLHYIRREYKDLWNAVRASAGN